MNIKDEIVIDSVSALNKLKSQYDLNIKESSYLHHAYKY